MVFIISSDQNQTIAERHDKVVRSHEFLAHRLAEELVHDAFLEHHSIVHAAERAFVTEQIRGYKEGFESAQKEQAMRMTEIVSRTIDYIGTVEKQLADLIFLAVKQILSDFNEQDKILSVAKTAISAMRSQKSITLKVHADNVEFLQKEIAEIKQAFPNINHIEVIAQGNVSPESCVVSTEIGSAEASISTQVEALRSALTNVFRKPRDNEIEAQSALGITESET